MKKKSQVILTPDNAGTGSAHGLQVIHKIKETQVPQSAVGPNPVA
jgi:hypothetical protein